MNWYVWRHDINKNSIVKWNIFEHWRFQEGIQKALQDYKDNKEFFIEAVKSNLIYCFWCKSEYEVLIAPWIGSDKPIKVDIYAQVMLNFDSFVDYVWNFRKEDVNE